MSLRRLLFHNRGADGPRHLTNAEGILQEFRSNGVWLESVGYWRRYSVAAREMSNVRLVMAVHGAWFANVLFLPEWGIAVEIQSSRLFCGLRRLTRALPVFHVVDCIRVMRHHEVGFGPGHYVYPIGQVQALVKVVKAVLQLSERREWELAGHRG